MPTSVAALFAGGAAPSGSTAAARWVQLAAAMLGAVLGGGFTPEEAGKIAGANYLRIFRAAVG